jgi:hypothetical protein
MSHISRETVSKVHPAAEICVYTSGESCANIRVGVFCALPSPCNVPIKSDEKRMKGAR